MRVIVQFLVNKFTFRLGQLKLLPNLRCAIFISPLSAAFFEDYVNRSCLCIIGIVSDPI